MAKNEDGIAYCFFFFTFRAEVMKADIGVISVWAGDPMKLWRRTYIIPLFTMCKDSHPKLLCFSYIHDFVA